jgi:peptide/nickel transport system substrate-binding protein
VKRIIIWGLVLILSLGLLAGCGDTAVTDVQVPTEPEVTIEKIPMAGGTIAVPIGYFNGLNPYLNMDRSMYYFNQLIFEGLYRVNEAGVVEPVLAESIVWSEGGRIATITLKSGIAFHDGSLLTAEDVAFTLRALQAGAEGFEYNQFFELTNAMADEEDLSQIYRVTATSDSELVVRYDQAYANAARALIFPIVKASSFGEDLSEQERIKNFYDAEYDYTPMGTGPFQYKTSEKLKSIELVRNEQWWQESPWLDGVTGVVVESQTGGIESFTNGILDVMMTTENDPQKYGQNEVRVASFETDRAEALFFNFHSELYEREEAAAIRRAIAKAIDQNAIINTVYGGHARPASYLLPPGINDGLIRPVDLASAKAELDAAGIVDGNDDGVRELDGRKFQMTLLVDAENSTRMKIAEQIKTDLAKIGVEILVRSQYTDKADLIQWYRTSLVEKQDDLVLLGWELGFVPDPGFALVTDESETTMNLTGYTNEAMDAILRSLFMTTDPAQWDEELEQWKEAMNVEMPILGLVNRKAALLVKGRVNGELNGNVYEVYRGMEHWFVEYEEKEINPGQ